MKTGDKGLFLYDLLRAGLPAGVRQGLDAQAGADEQRRGALRRARDEGRFEGLLAALELLPADARRRVREAIVDATRAAWDAGPSDHLFVDEELRRAKAEGTVEGMRDGVFVLLHAGRLAVTLEQRARILACADRDQLDRWLRAAATAASADALFPQ